MILQLAEAKGVTEEVARQQIVDLIGGIPIGRPGKPQTAKVRFSCRLSV